MPRLTELCLFDNSEEAYPDMGVTPLPRVLLHMANGKIVSLSTLTEIPAWAKPIVEAAVKL